MTNNRFHSFLHNNLNCHNNLRLNKTSSRHHSLRNSHSTSTVLRHARFSRYHYKHPSNYINHLHHSHKYRYTSNNHSKYNNNKYNCKYQEEES